MSSPPSNEYPTRESSRSTIREQDIEYGFSRAL